MLIVIQEQMNRKNSFWSVLASDYNHLPLMSTNPSLPISLLITLKQKLRSTQSLPTITFFDSYSQKTSLITAAIASPNHKQTVKSDPL